MIAELVEEKKYTVAESFILMLFSVLLSSFGFLQAQTAVLTQTGCNSVSVSLTGACLNAFEGRGYFSNGRWFLNDYHNYTYKVTLVKLSGGSLPFPEITYRLEAGSTAPWVNLESGATYRVIAQAFGCTNVPASDVAGRELGFVGIWGNTFPSNDITVGQTLQSDIAFNFLDANGSTIFGNTQFFAPNEEVRINTSAMKNYDKYLLAIQEFYPDGVTQGRWRGYGNGGYGGWQTGQMPAIVNLTNSLWAAPGVSNWDFIPGYSYRLQIVLSKDACPSWTQSLPFFFICQSGWGCRAGGEKKMDNKIVLSPNPASYKFRLDGINFIDTKNCSLSISDISGKEVQRFNDVTTNEFAINGLMNGVYIVSITADNRRLFSSKLVINH